MALAMCVTAFVALLLGVEELLLWGEERGWWEFEEDK